MSSLLLPPTQFGRLTRSRMAPAWRVLVGKECSLIESFPSQGPCHPMPGAPVDLLCRRFFNTLSGDRVFCSYIYIYMCCLLFFLLVVTSSSLSTNALLYIISPMPLCGPFDVTVGSGAPSTGFGRRWTCLWELRGDGPTAPSSSSWSSWLTCRVVVLADVPRRRLG